MADILYPDLKALQLRQIRELNEKVHGQCPHCGGNIKQLVRPCGETRIEDAGPMHCEVCGTAFGKVPPVNFKSPWLVEIENQIARLKDGDIDNMPVGP